MDIDSAASSVRGSSSSAMPAIDHVSQGRVIPLSSGVAEENRIVSTGASLDLPEFSSSTSNSAVSADLPGLAAALAGPALSSESLQRAREIAERRLRGVRRLMEENLREDLELQVTFLPTCFFLRFLVCDSLLFSPTISNNLSHVPL
jgi:hypothetical protein